MKYDEVNRTFDCEPTLTDSQVLQFCRDGYLCNYKGLSLMRLISGHLTISTAICP